MVCIYATEMAKCLDDGESGSSTHVMPASLRKTPEALYEASTGWIPVWMWTWFCGKPRAFFDTTTG
jgi:hypothetical protein